MCGRFSLAYEDWGAMLDYFGVQNPDFVQQPRYNVAPGQSVTAIVANQKERRIGQLNWGLTVHFATEGRPSKPIINARAETLLEKPAFRSLVTKRRCIIPADGFYEWKETTRGAKQPYRMVLKSQPFFAFAGLYDIRTLADGTRESSCVILTTAPNEVMRPIHNRMPVILTSEALEIWLDTSITNGERLVEQLGAYPAEDMRAYPVSSIVGNFRNDIPACFEEALVPQTNEGLFDGF